MENNIFIQKCILVDVALKETDTKSSHKKISGINSCINLRKPKYFSQLRRFIGMESNLTIKRLSGQGLSIM